MSLANPRYVGRGDSTCGEVMYTIPEIKVLLRSNQTMRNVGSDNGDPLRDNLLPLAACVCFFVLCNSRFGQYTRSSTEQFQYGTVTSARLLGQNYRKLNHNMVRHYVFIYISFFSQQWLLALDDRPCFQYVQSTRRMSITPTRPSTRG